MTPEHLHVVIQRDAQHEANAKAEQERLMVRFEGEDGACRKLPPPPTLPSVVRVYLVNGRIAVAAQPTG